MNSINMKSKNILPPDLLDDIYDEMKMGIGSARKLHHPKR